MATRNPLEHPGDYVRHLGTCTIGRCGRCGNPRASDLHYSGAADSHLFVQQPCNCGREVILEALRGIEWTDYEPAEPEAAAHPSHEVRPGLQCVHCGAHPHGLDWANACENQPPAQKEPTP